MPAADAGTNPRRDSHGADSTETKGEKTLLEEEVKVEPEAPLEPPSLADRIRKLGAEREVDASVVAVLLAIADELAALRQ